MTRAKEERSARRAARAARDKQLLRLGGIILLLLACALGAFYLFSSSGTSEDKTAGEEPVVGILDLQQLMEKHPDYAKLQELQQECTRLETVIAIQKTADTVTLPDTQTDKQLFQQAASQKNRLDAIERHSELVDELNARAEEKRQAMKPEFDAEREQVSKPYLNEMLNLRVKIDSADVLGLTDAQVQQMLARIDELQKLRSDALVALDKEQEQRFQEIIAAENSAPLAELNRLEASYQQEAQQDALNKALEVQQRNTEQMEQALSPIQKKIDNAKRQTMLEAKKLQLQQLRDKIYDDIAGRAAKFAIMHKLTLVLSSPADNLPAYDNDFLSANPKQPLVTPVLGINTVDLTEEILQDIETIPFKE